MYYKIICIRLPKIRGSHTIHLLIPPNTIDYGYISNARHTTYAYVLACYVRSQYKIFNFKAVIILLNYKYLQNIKTKCKNPNPQSCCIFTLSIYHHYTFSLCSSSLQIIYENVNGPIAIPPHFPFIYVLQLTKVVHSLKIQSKTSYSMYSFKYL